MPLILQKKKTNRKLIYKNDKNEKRPVSLEQMRKKYRLWN